MPYTPVGSCEYQDHTLFQCSSDSIDQPRIRQRRVHRPDLSGQGSLYDLFWKRVKNDVANCVLAGLVEIMLYALSSEIIPDAFTYKIGDGIIKKGVAVTLNEDLNIKFGK